MIRSGVPGIDAFLRGGLRGGCIADVYGPPGSGKTQIAFQMCALAAAAGSRVLFQDTKGEFRPERVLEMAGPAGRAGGLLDRIDVMRVTNTREQASCASRVAPGISLAIVDDVTGLFSFEYGKDDRPLARDKAFMRYMRGLSGAALAASVPVVVTNTVRTVDGEDVENMGRAMGLFAHFRIRLSAAPRGVLCEMATAGRREEAVIEVGPGGVADGPQSI